MPEPVPCDASFETYGYGGGPTLPKRVTVRCPVCSNPVGAIVLQRSASATSIRVVWHELIEGKLAP